MLKIVKTSITIATLSLFTAGVAQANVGQTLQSNCTIVKADDKGELRKKMKRVQSDFNLKLKDNYESVSCGNKNLTRISMSNNLG